MGPDGGRCPECGGATHERSVPLGEARLTASLCPGCGGGDRRVESGKTCACGAPAVLDGWCFDHAPPEEPIAP